MEVRLPRLLDANMNEVARLNPSALSISPSGDALSTATMTLPPGEARARMRDWVELYTPHGSAGIYRVTRRREDAVEGQRLTLTHGLCALEDAVIPGEGTLCGSPGQVIAAILAHQKRALWTLGRAANGPSVEVEYSYTNALEALEDMLGKLGDYALTFDQSSLPWKLGLTALSDIDSPAATCATASQTAEQFGNEDKHSPAATDATAVQTAEQFGNEDKHSPAATCATAVQTAEQFGNEDKHSPAATCATASQMAALSGNEDKHSPAATCATAAQTTTPFGSEKGEAEARLSRNLQSASVEEDDGELCTRVYVDGREGFVRDGPTIGTWGVIERVLTLPAGATDADVEEYASAYLREHQHPARTLTLDALDLSGETGEPLDAMRLWKQVRVPLENETLRERIRALSYPDVFDEPLSVRVSAGRKPDDLSELLERLRANAAATDRSVARNSRQIQKNITRLEDTYHELVELDGVMTDRFNEVSIELDAQQAQIRLKASQKEVSELGERVSSAEIAIDGANARIDLKVSKGEVISQINVSTEGIRIQASRINLDGYVTASQLEAEIANFNHLLSGEGTISKLVVRNVNVVGRAEISTLDVAGHGVAWKSATVVTGVTLKLTRASALYMAPSSGAPATVQVNPVTGGSVDTDTTTIYYLGR